MLEIKTPYDLGERKKFIKLIISDGGISCTQIFYPKNAFYNVLQFQVTHWKKKSITNCWNFFIIFNIFLVHLILFENTS